MYYLSLKYYLYLMYGCLDEITHYLNNERTNAARTKYVTIHCLCLQGMQTYWLTDRIQCRSPKPHHRSATRITTPL